LPSTNLLIYYYFLLQNLGANTYNTALMIGEKAAVLAAEHLGFDILPKDEDRLGS
jgi:hypothetical protein